MSNNLNSWMTIGDLAKRSAVSVATLRFYEEKELIWSIRTEGNQRRYQRAMLRRVAIIKVAQQVGLSLNEIKRAFCSLPKHKVASKDDWQKLSQQWQQDLDQRIIKLLQLRNQLNWCIGCGCLSQEQCPLYNPDDAMANESAGAHFKEIVLKLSDFDQVEES